VASHIPESSSKPSTTGKASYTLEDANKELAQLISSKQIQASDFPALKSVLKEHGSLKEKVDKLKSLLGRSAKVQREAKVDLEATQKRLAQALREIERLNQKLDKLQSRPTHRKFHLRSY
jgi:chromosome segregation ATPase